VKFLLDTVVWVWSIDAIENIGKRGLEILEDGRQDIFLSPVSSWELSIKMRLGKLSLPKSPAACVSQYMVQQGLRPLPIAHSHTVKVYDLPNHHRDPFDRLLIAQALTENMVILTADHAFEKYPIEVIWCGK